MLAGTYTGYTIVKKVYQKRYFEVYVYVRIVPKNVLLVIDDLLVWWGQFVSIIYDSSMV